MISRTDRPSRGFSVIEILVALMIIGLIMSAIYAALVGTLQTKAIIEKEIDDVKQGGVIFEMIRRDLQAACPLRMDEILFKAKDGRLASRAGGKINFLASRWTLFPDESDSGRRKEGDDPPVRSPICEIGYFLRPNPDMEDRYILYRREDFFVDSNFEKGGIYLKLSSSVKELTFSFYHGDEIEKSKEPETRWDGEDEQALPKAVSVRLVIDREEGRANNEKGERVFEAVIPILAGGGDDEEEAE
jgi:prepilin-type N-terminal cleavage/methylation domain-containing protein